MTGVVTAQLPGWVTPRKLYLAAAAVCFIIIGLAALSLWSHFKSFEASSIERVELYARVLEDQVNRTFNSANATILAVADSASSQKKVQPHLLNDFLNQQIQQTAFLRSLSVLNASGTIIASSNADNINQMIDLQKLGIKNSSSSESGTYSPIGETQLGVPTSGRDLSDTASASGTTSRFTFVPYARSFQFSADSENTNGWIVAAFNPDFFANQHALLLDSESRNASMLSMQSAYIATTDTIKPEMVQKAHSHPFFKSFLPAKESGSLIGSGLSGNEVVSAFRTARNQPVVIVVEEAYALAIKPFSSTLQQTIAVLIVFIGLILTLTQVAISRLQHHLRAIQIEDERQHTLQAMEDLKAQQTQLIQAEKIASLSLLVANVAHEINTPIGAIKSSGALIGDALKDALAQLPSLFAKLSNHEQELFNQLIQQFDPTTPALSTKEERNITRKITQQLQEAGLQTTQSMGRLLLQFNAQDTALKYLPLLQHTDSELIILTASNISTALGGSKNINSAVERVSRIIFALKEFSSADKTGEKMPLDLQQSIEDVFTKYKSQMHSSFEILRTYENIAPLPCLPEEIKQVCAHVLHNAFLAMHFQGPLSVCLKREDNYAVITVVDSGCGIREDHLPRIFDAFFTTRSSGEGSGLGLAVVKKIINKHAGRIEVSSTIGKGTTVTIYLPYS